jgi:hypothetical protein
MPLIHIKGIFAVRVLFHVDATCVGENHGANNHFLYLERRYTALESEIADALRQSPTDDLAIRASSLPACRRAGLICDLLKNRQLGSAS